MIFHLFIYYGVFTTNKSNHCASLYKKVVFWKMVLRGLHLFPEEENRKKELLLQERGRISENI